jgi:hypothetical protein
MVMKDFPQCVVIFAGEAVEEGEEKSWSRWTNTGLWDLITILDNRPAALG